MSSVSAIVPTWNQRNLLVALLNNLAGQTRPPEEVLVIDNGSEDGSADEAERLGARVVRMDHNAGFSRAVNEGVRASSGDWVAVLNNDVELSPDWLERSQSGAEESGAWFAVGRLYRAGSTEILDGTFDTVSRSGCAWRCGQGRRDGAAWAAPRRVSFPPFTAVLVRRELFDRVGLLDEDYESYLEDVDFGLRCALAGCEGLYEPEAVGWHRGSATLGRWHPDVVRRLARNQLVLVAKHYPDDWPVRLGWPVLVGQLLWGLVALRHGAARAYCQGKLDGLRMFPRLRRRGERRGITEILIDSERTLHELQRESGFDWYWKAYFALT